MGYWPHRLENKPADILSAGLMRSTAASVVLQVPPMVIWPLLGQAHFLWANLAAKLLWHFDKGIETRARVKK